MAYFPNGSSGDGFMLRCGECRFGSKGCPVQGLQLEFNYSQVNAGNELAREMLSRLVGDDGSCTMYDMAEGLFFDDTEDLFADLREIEIVKSGAAQALDAATEV
jgi:hypothetical protein